MTMTKEERDAHEQDRNRCVKRFGIKPEEFVGYNHGGAYDKIWVTTREAAEKCAAHPDVKNGTCNGGWFDGMPLGGITAYDGEFEVMV